MRLQIIPPQGRLRAAVETMVRDVYRSEYGADSPHFPDLMIAVIDATGRPQCTAGFRDHTCRFFSEQYLNLPAQSLIAAQIGEPVSRDQVVELGPLAAIRPGALLTLLIGFAHIGLGSGYHWGIFTATDRLRRLAQRLGIPLIDLGPALPGNIANAAAWGSYYDHDPRVCAVDGQAARQRLLTSRLPSSAEPQYREALAS